LRRIATVSVRSVYAVAPTADSLGILTSMTEITPHSAASFPDDTSSAEFHERRFCLIGVTWFRV